ncbi:MAG: RDD family protein [Elusimicrobia bacterium]|nr:RDD family protein [Elusimicrobiota bacterium]
MNTTERPTETNSLPVAETRPAGFWIRCGAFTTDFLLAFLIPLIISWLLSNISNFVDSDAYSICSVFALFAIINVFFSVGKHLAGIDIVRIDGSLLTRYIRLERCLLGPALVALLIMLWFYPSINTHVEAPFSVYFGLFVMGILLVPAALPRKRALHDYLTRTHVAYVKEINLWRKAAVICIGFPLVIFYIVISVNLTRWGKALYDAKLEPNNSPETATRLNPEQSVDGRAVSRNPNVFSVEAKAGQIITFYIENHGGPMDRAAFKVLTPKKKTLYEDILRLHTHYSEIIRPSLETYPDVTLSINKELDYELRVIAKMEGTYYLIINEYAQRGSRIPLVWKYHLTTTVK